MDTSILKASVHMRPIYNAQPHPHLGAGGLALMHSDAQSSDATPLPGPGKGPWNATEIKLGGACPTVLVGSDGIVQILSTQLLGEDAVGLRPTVILLDAAGRELSKLALTKGSLLGGVYAYLDNRDRMVVVDGSGTLLRIAHDDSGKAWVDSRIDLTDWIPAGSADGVVGLVPDWDGRIWVATVSAGVAVVDMERGSVRATVLGSGERVDNSISAAPEGVCVVTSHAAYLLRASNSAAPTVVWRTPYDRGSFRKPGRLSWGSGATPTFFGPSGSDYLMLSDNGDEHESVLVLNASTGAIIGKQPLFKAGASAAEDSMIGVGNTLVAANTYGYPYPKEPAGAPPAQPSSAMMGPGVERWDVTGAGLVKVWSREDVYSSAVPRYSSADGLIYTCERPPWPLSNGPVIYAMAIDIETGETVYRQKLPGLITVFGVDTLQMVGTIDRNGTWWQGTIGGVYRIAKA